MNGKKSEKKKILKKNEILYKPRTPQGMIEVGNEGYNVCLSSRTAQPHSLTTVSLLPSA